MNAPNTTDCKEPRAEPVKKSEKLLLRECALETADVDVNLEDRARSRAVDPALRPAAAKQIQRASCGFPTPSSKTPANTAFQKVPKDDAERRWKTKLALKSQNGHKK